MHFTIQNSNLAIFSFRYFLKSFLLWGTSSTHTHIPCIDFVVWQLASLWQHFSVSTARTFFQCRVLRSTSDAHFLLVGALLNTLVWQQHMQTGTYFGIIFRLPILLVNLEIHFFRHFPPDVASNELGNFEKSSKMVKIWGKMKKKNY